MSGSQELFVIDVNVLTFTFPDKEGAPIESSCNIHNITADYIAFRTKTTKKEEYAVKPTHAIIAPYTTIKISFIKNTSGLDPTGHKFKFDSMVIPPSLKDKDPKIIFDLSGKKKTPQYSVKLGVEFAKAKSNPLVQSMYSVKDAADSQMRNSSLMDISQKEKLESLKIEFYKLKNQLITLTKKKNELLNRVDIEKRSETSSNKKTSKCYNNNNIVSLPEPSEKKVSNTTLIILCGFALLLGYYIAK